MRTIGVATNNLGLFLKGGGKYDEAIAKFKASIELLVKANDRANEAIGAPQSRQHLRSRRPIFPPRRIATGKR